MGGREKGREGGGGRGREKRRKERKERKKCMGDNMSIPAVSLKVFKLEA